MTLLKMISLPALLLVLMIVAITNVVDTSEKKLLKEQNDEVKDLYIQNKNAELRNYFELAKQSIEHLLGPDQLDEVSFKKALSILRHLSFGEEDHLDGYFFLFTQDGTFLMHSRQPALEGKNFLNPETIEDGNEKDKERSIQLKKIIEHARDIKDDGVHKGNYVDYQWEKPSKGEKAGFFPKRAYVEIIKGLGVLGTGVYLDDIDRTLKDLGDKTDKNIKNTMNKILLIFISFLAFMGIVIFLLMRDRRLVDTKLAELYKRNIKIQDQERSRISNQLHDSVKPLIIAARRKTEMSINNLRKLILSADAIKPEAILNELEDSVSITNLAIEEIKREINKFSSLDIELLSIEDALRSYINKITSESLPIIFNVFGEQENELAYSAKEALSLVAREALNNALSHSGATAVTVNLNFESDWITLEIIDNGHGFKESSLNQSQGLGLRNMKERIKVENGEFHITSSDKGTSVITKIPS